MKSLILVYVFIIIKFFMDLFNRIVYVWKCYDRLNNGNNLYLSFNLFVWSLLQVDNWICGLSSIKIKG